MIKVGVVGGTGYTGVELLRILLRHPGVTVMVITSRGETGRRLDHLFPSLLGACDLQFTDPAEADFSSCDVVFFATPHNVAMREVPALLDEGVRVIDLSADFRLKDVTEWERWYGETHAAPSLCEEAVYGLPETHRDAIREARLVACPGCYPTAVQLGFLPLLEAGVIDPMRLIASCGSGVSGAGRQAKLGSLLTEAGESVAAYGVAGHRHLPEMEQGLASMTDAPIQLTFVPHLMPMSRGIHATLFAPLTKEVDLQHLFEQRFAAEPCVHVLPAGVHPATRNVRGANTCQLSVAQPQGRDTVVVMSAIDNLVKGAAGQAVQVMNLIMQQPETAGLDGIALAP
ncbi:MAG: N-acetyl-gamma-glutamyl-phosphate reductase [Luminiphilus sp.]|nr:N-acetyl-gamma-glutamyl-phosphate reductase [Luminiphilus sp.]